MALSFAAEFSFEPYLYEGEDASSVSVERLTSGYDLVSISGQKSFLLLENNIVDDSGIMRSALNDHYAATALPSQAEISELILLAKEFNSTRNLAAEHDLSKGSETACVYHTAFLNSFKLTMYGANTPSNFCYNYKSCEQLPPIEYIQGLNQIYWFIEAKVVHGVTLFALDNNMSEFEASLRELTPENAATNLQTVMNNIAGMKKSAKFLKASVLQNPGNMGGPCDESNIDPEYLEAIQAAASEDPSRDALLALYPIPACMGVCPNVMINESMADDLAAKAEALFEKAMPLANLDQEVSDLLARTTERKTYQLNSEKRGEYLLTYSGLNTRLDNVHRLTNVSALRNAVYNDLNTLEVLSNQINSSIELKNFELTEQLVTQFRERADSLEARLSKLVPTYTKAEQAKLSAERELIRAEFNTVQGETDALEKLHDYKDAKYQLDSKFAGTSSLNDFAVLEVNYTELSTTLEGFNDNLDSLHASQVTTILSGTTRGAMMNSLSLWNGISPMTPAQMRENARMMPAVLIGAADLVVVLLSLVAFFLFAFINKRIVWRKDVTMTWAAIFLVLFAIVGAASLGIHQLVQAQSEQPTTLGLFYSGLEASNVSAVSYDTANLTQSQILALQACTKEINAKMKAQGIAMDTYMLSGSSCKVGTDSKSLEDCNTALSQVPHFTLRYNVRNSTSFRTFYEYAALVEGDAAYIKQCDIAKVL